MIHWNLKSFAELSVNDLYKIMQLRMAVFVVEQNCAFQDADDKDQKASHLCAWQGDKLVAYTRILAPGISYTEASIGRVVTDVSIRGAGFGKELMQRSMSAVYQLFGTVPIRIGAQLYLKKFYESLGFIVDGPVYLEDNIEHIVMVCTTT